MEDVEKRQDSGLVKVCLHVGIHTSGSAYSRVRKNDIHATVYPDNCYGVTISPPTAVLLNSNKELIKFGYEASGTYMDLEDGEKDDYYYFKNLKSLFCETSSQTTTLEDISGKAVDAIDVVSQIFRFIKERVQATMSKECFRDDDYYFVLTVPANSNNYIRHVFWESMKKTGTSADKVCTLSDAVAAYLTCRRDTKKRRDERLSYFTLDWRRQEADIKGKILVIDIGDERSNITVLESDTESEVVQVATGIIPWGVQCFYQAFYDMLTDLFSEAMMDDYKRNNSDDWDDLCTDLKRKIILRRFDDRYEYSTNITLPFSLIECVRQKYGTITDAIKNSKFKNDITYRRTIMQIKANGITELIFKPVNTFVNYVQAVMQHTELTDIETVLLVGECAANEYLKERLMGSVKKSISIIEPNQPETAVLQGGVLYGHNLIKVIRAEHHFNLSPVVDNHATGLQTSTNKCVSCQGDGKFYCYECSSIYCENCRKTHDRFPAIKSHKMTDLKKADHSISRPGVLCCNTHKDVYTHACESCNVLICSKCVTTTHKGHNFSDISLMVQERRQHLAKDVSVLKSGLLKLESEVADIQSMDIESTAQKDIEEVETVKRQIIDVVERHVFFRSNEVDDVLQMQQEELKYGLHRKQRILDQQRTLLTSLERLIEDEHDVSFFMAYNVLRKELIDVNDVIGNPLTSEIRPLDKRAFLESTVNSIISSFGLCAAEVTDGKVTLKTHQSDKTEKK